jgi:hypothetical protein
VRWRQGKKSPEGLYWLQDSQAIAGLDHAEASGGAERSEEASALPKSPRLVEDS